MIRHPGVVSIEERDPLRLRVQDTEIARRIAAWPRFRSAQDQQPLVPVGCQPVDAAVRRGVVDHKDFRRRFGLRNDRLDGAFNMGSLVVEGDYDREIRHRIRRPLRADRPAASGQLAGRRFAP